MRKGRLQPGRMFLVDTEQGRIVERRGDQARRSSASGPTGEWLDAAPGRPRRICPSRRDAAPTPEHETLLQRQQAFGYTFEDLAHPDGADGARRRRGRGLDGQRHAAGGALRQAAAALQLLQAALRPGDQPADRLASAKRSSRQPRRCLGSEGNLLEPEPAALPHASSCKRPILTNEELAKLRHIDHARLQGRHAADPVPRRRAARRAWRRRAGRAAAPTRQRLIEKDEVNILILSDRGVEQGPARRSRRCWPSPACTTT